MNRQEWFQENQCSIDDFVANSNYSQAFDQLKRMRQDFEVLSKRLGVAFANAHVISWSEDGCFCINSDGEVLIPAHYLAKFCSKVVAELILSELKQQIQIQEKYAKAALEEMVE